MVESFDTEETDSSILHRPYEKKPPRSFRSWLLGRPLPTADAPHQTIGKAVGLAVFARDALSSMACATQETLVILAAAGVAGMSYAFPVAAVVTILLVIVTICFIPRLPWQPPRTARCEPASDATSRIITSISEIFRTCCD